MDKKYNHHIVESNKYDAWIAKDLFSIHDDTQEPFCIILPPPNITGQLHLGHAQNSAIQDALIRYKKLRGYDALFVPSFDHAGISAQIRVEKELHKRNLSREKLGKKAFIQEVEKWKVEHQDLIRNQWAKLGLALDFSYERFTMDQKMVESVQKVFIKMYEDGLVYRAPRAILWDPKSRTALSNIEVEYRETQSKMYYVKYDLKDSKEHIVIATTRPETIFSDVAIVLNPKDPRLGKFRKKVFINPLNGRELGIITDSHVEADFGTGMMKCSAHAEEDLRIIREHKLQIIECINEQGKMNKNAGNYEGQDRFEARINVVQYLQISGKIEKIVDINNNVAYSQRTNEPIEIMFSTQWFVRMPKLAQLVLDSLNSSKSVKFVPERFKATLEQWMENAHDWTISRQLWWGHPIPAWHRHNEIKVQIESPGSEWKADEDILDTWFSSALAPFAFFDWLDDTSDYRRYYPTNVLVTAYDIIFFWVARMYFQGLYLTKKIPFKEVIIHGLIRDEKGEKMSKSKGNGIDPIDMINQYGADALRWSLLTKSTLGYDFNFSQEIIKNAWNINNKIWNIARYVLENMKQENNQLGPVEIWIYKKLNTLTSNVEKSFENYDFTIFGTLIHDFIFQDFSSSFIELTKEKPNQQVALDILKKLMILIHPVMPFISEDIYLRIEPNKYILQDRWPLLFNRTKKTHVTSLIELISSIRRVRSEEKINPKTSLNVFMENSNFELNQIAQVEKLTNVIFHDKVHKTDNCIAIMGKDYHVSLEIPQEAITKRAEKISAMILFYENEVVRSKKILENEKFISKAPREKINEERKKLEEYMSQLQEWITLRDNNGE